MSYTKAKLYKYTIIPTKSYPVKRNCAKCGGKATFINTNNFRVNANGNLIDVWLIYQCEKCKHTYNLSLYERVKSSCLDKAEYKKFLANDSKLALKYGTDKSIFARNKACIDAELISYDIVADLLAENGDSSIIINNPFMLKLRSDKVLAEILDIPRSQVKKLIDSGEITIPSNYLLPVTICEIILFSN